MQFLSAECDALVTDRIDWSPPQQADSPTFNRAAMEEEKEEEEGEEEEEDEDGGEEREQEVMVLPNPPTANEEPIVWKVQFLKVQYDTRDIQSGVRAEKHSFSHFMFMSEE